MPTEDPFYTRKRIPDEFTEHIGDTGLTKVEEEQNRERKYSVNGVDIRKFDKKATGGWQPAGDPYYHRKPVPDSQIQGVGETGLTAEEEYENRERKYSVTGVDVRRFDKKATGGWEPAADPYYHRKSVPKHGIDGVGETGMSKAEAFDAHENKAALFGDSSDPFQLMAGTGHRASVSGQAAPVAEAARRRSSAVAPDHMHAAAEATAAHGHNSGYTGGHSLEPIESRVEDDRINSSSQFPHSTTTTTTTTTTSTGLGYNQASTADTGHGLFYDEATVEPHNIAPHQKV